VKESRWGLHFPLINLALVEFMDNKNAILKYGGEKVTNAEDLLSSGIAR